MKSHCFKSHFRAAMFLLVASMALLPLTASAQKVTIDASAAKLSSVFEEIQKQVPYKFVYNNSFIDVNRKVTLNVENKELKEVLNQLFEETDITWEIKSNSIILSLKSFRQNKDREPLQITGTVFDENGIPLPGCTVLIKSNGKYTITDEEGRYSIEALAGDVLTFSFVGMIDKSVKVTPESKTVNVTLEPSMTQLEEVVVTGYQTISKERATGSFDKVNTKILSSRPTSNISNALQGMVAGMQAKENEDGSVNFLIRGTSSLYADREPLLVIDGFPTQGDFSSINPNDVESVTVLKDAAAASIWGTRSANGVIVITTKKGSKDKLQIDLSAFVRIATNPDLDYILNQADSRTMIDYEMKAQKNNWKMGSWEYTPNFYGLQNSLTLSQELFYANKYYGLSDAEMNAGLDRLRNMSNRKQLKKYLMRPAILQQYNVSVRNGSERSQNYLSLMFEKNNENTIKRGYNKFMINYNSEFKLTKWLKARLITTLQRTNRESSGVTISEFSQLSPYEMLLNEDGSYATNLKTYNRAELAKLPLDKLPYSDWSYNMLREVRGRDYRSNSTMYRIQFGLNAQIVKGLFYDMSAQYESSTTETQNYNSDDTFYARDMVNTFTEYNSATKEVGKSYLPKGGMLNHNKYENSNYVFRNQLNYSDIFADKHEVSALAGLEISQYDDNTTFYPIVYGYNRKKNITDLPAYGYGSWTNIFWNFFGYPAFIYGGGTGFNIRCDRYVSYYFNAGYTYDKKYGISFSARGDGSNFVSDDPALRWAPLWSVGAKWNISNEKFMQNIDWINYLSLRTTYGVNGNAEKSTSPLTLIDVSSQISPVTGTMLGSISNLGNPQLRWEKTYTTNIGIDFDLFQNRLSGKMEFYNRHSKDVIGDVTIPSVYGTSSQRFNNAEILNRGFELELTGNFNFPSIDFKFNSTVTYAYNYNKILKLFYPALYCSELVYSSTHVEGKPVGSLYSYEFLGTENGIPYVIGVNGDKISMNDVSIHNRSLGLDILKYSGTVIPPHTFGWANEFTWKDLSLYIYMTGNFGGIFRVPITGCVPSVGMDKIFIDNSIKYFAESDGKTHPTWPNKDESHFYLWDRYNDNLSYWVQDASFLRLAEINLSYNLPKKVVNKLHIKGSKIFMQARNVCLITANDYNFDPEWLPGTNKPAATILIGANIQF